MVDYVETKWDFAVESYDEYICKPEYEASIVESIKKDGDVRIESQFTTSDEIETAIYQLTSNDTGCKTTKTNTCNPVEVEYYTSDSLTAFTEYSSEYDETLT